MNGKDDRNSESQDTCLIWIDNTSRKKYPCRTNLFILHFLEDFFSTTTFLQVLRSSTRIFYKILLYLIVKSCIMRTKPIDYPRSDNQSISIDHFANIVLDVSILLLESGAHCERINRNIQRIASNSPYDVEMLLSFTAVSISVYDKNSLERSITVNKRIKHHGVHYGVLTNTSLLTWQLSDKEISLCELIEKIKDVKEAPKYSVWLVRFFIGIACACLCLLINGDWIDAGFAFLASFVGLIVRQEMIKTGFNLMVSITCSAFITTSISGIDVLFNIGTFPSSSVATAVLFLIPGVPLINSIIDLIEGYIPVGIARGAFGGFILLCIAIGMFLSMNILGISNF